jgi:glycosyltransferase involved in cell wall biosynthesis
MRVAIVTTDNREFFKKYELAEPWISPPIAALLEGFQSAENAADVQVHILSCTRRRMRSPERLAPNIFFHSLYVPKIGWMRTLYQGCIRTVRKKLKEIRPEIVHGQGTERDCAITAVFSGFPNLLTIHGNLRLIAKLTKPGLFSYNWLAARLEGFTIPRSQGVICITRYTQTAVSDLARSTWVVPNAVEASFFEIDAHRPGGGVPRILCVGLVCERKNQNALIRALDPLTEKLRFELVFLGGAREDDPYGEGFLRLVKARSWCTHGGNVGRDELKAYLREATMLVLPSLEDNCPMTVLEAMAAGVPVVASRVGGLPDLITDGQTGFFCDPLAAASMAAAIERVLLDRSAAAEVARQARERARERFHPVVIARRHLEIYREVLSTRR